MTTAPELIRGVAHSQFSIARYYGGLKFNGQQYYWCPVDDSLIRADILKARKEWRVIRSAEKEAPNEWLGEPYKTRAKAVKAAKADRSGRLVCVFGPQGIDCTTFFKNGVEATP